MNNLEQFLFSHTKHELEQLMAHNFIADFPELNTGSQHSIPVISQNIFGNNKEVYVSKHSRYADYPAHSHQFLEINYMYHGTCQQTINGIDYTFKAGDIILMDGDSVQSINALGEEDILINILFRDKDISLESLTQFKLGNSLIYDLFLNSTIDDPEKRNFAVFSAEKTQEVLPVIHQLLQEYFFPKDFSDKIIHHYLSILVFHLARTLAEVKQEEIFQKSDDPFTKVLSLIEKEYKQLTLTNVAQQLNFNKNYLSNLIKEKSGQTFTDLLHKKKLGHAKLLLESTQLSIQEVAQQSGFSNRTFFYKKFEELYGHKPSHTKNRDR